MKGGEILLCLWFSSTQHFIQMLLLYCTVRPLCVWTQFHLQLSVCWYVWVCACFSTCLREDNVRPQRSQCEHLCDCMCMCLLWMQFYPFAPMCPCRCTAQYKHRGVNKCVLGVWMRGRGSCSLSSAIIPSLLCSPWKYFHTPPFLCSVSPVIIWAGWLFIF